MINKKAKEIAKEIDKKVQKRRAAFYKKQKSISNKVDFAYSYQICPICANKLSYPFLKNAFSNLFFNTFSNTVTWKCKKCKKLYIITWTYSGDIYYKLKKVK